MIKLIYRTWAFQIVHVIGPWGEELGFRFGPVPGTRASHWAFLFLGLGKWVWAPIF